MLFDKNEIDKKDKLLIVFLKSISNSKPKEDVNIIGDFNKQKPPYINDTRYKSRIKILKKLYFKTNYRHSYNIISSYLTSSKKDINLETLADNMRVILKRLLDTYQDCLLEYKTNEDQKAYSEFIEIVYKLNDHISLDAIRLNDLLETENSLIQNTKKAEEKIENKASSINKELTKVQTLVEEKITKANDEINGELKKTRTEYITILGIFASIIISFVAGLSFSTSVLSNIDKVSIYRLTFIICLIGLFITNILYYLFAFLDKIHQGKNHQHTNKSIIIFNSIMIILMISIFIYWKFFN